MLIPTTLPPLGSPRSKESTVRPEITLEQPSGKTKSTGSKSNKLLRRVRSVFRSLPIMSPMCKFPGGGGTRVHENHVHHGGTRVTGTLFGYRKTRVNIAIQETPRSLPILVLELAIPTAKLLQDLGVGLVRIALDGGGGGEGDLTYMRAHFERVIGSRDSETYYMMNPDGNSGPELSIFFVRV
ncbi:hypothetical protein HID58_039554 [Brassica napus]|uniref:Protein MIZU-KUSSEI 1-like n=1 Tax=Brassica napus TaxID=3708 RepID=A0ABQ8BSC8_BRANA|nr:hypothetical protein HID58_039554 [Brassica napus]